MKISGCRACGSEGLLPILSLGKTPLANALLTQTQLAEPEDTFPLEVVFCPACSLVQINETVPPEVLFREYVYLSSVSDTVVENARLIVERMIRDWELTPHSYVAEIASNDGYLLQFYQAAGIPTLGIEPALNIAKIAQAKGIPTIAEFFDDKLAATLHDRGIMVDVIHGNNVLAHVAALNELVKGVGTLLKPQGVGVFEFPYVRDLIEKNEFDTIYHEHLCYYSLTSVEKLFGQHGLEVVDVERIPIHGGSLRLFVSHRRQDNAISPYVEELRTEEHHLGIDQAAYYQDFGRRVDELRTALVECLHDLKQRGYSIAAYGASAKGATLLNTFGIGGKTIDFIVDRSPAKQGLYAPGTHIPILSPNALLEKRPDYCLLLTWNFADEILAQQQEYRYHGGQFILPIPTLTLL